MGRPRQVRAWLSALSVATAFAFGSGCSSADDPKDAGAEQASSDDATSDDAGDETGESGASTDDSDDGADEAGADFLGPMDVSEEVEIPCDFWGEGEECPDDQKCQWGAGFGGGCSCGTGAHLTQCAPAGTAQIGEPCCAPLAGMTCDPAGPNGVADSCVPGARCHFLALDTNEGICVEYCRGSEAEPSCPITGNECRFLMVDGWLGPLPICPDLCDPLDPAACPQGQTCAESRETTGAVDLFSCVDAGASKPYGDPCDALVPGDCEAGLVCAQASTVGMDCPDGGHCCAALCDLEAPDTCPGLDQACIPLFAPEDTAYGSLGACLEGE